MAKETVGVEVDVQFQSVGNLKKEIRAATADVIAMQEKFGEASKEAIAAAKRVNELKDKIKDAKEVTDLFDPGNKFKALGNAVAGVASGFTAVQGAMGLFGAESKELEKQLLKVQSAMALSQGLSAFLDSGKDFKRLSASIQNSSVVLKLNAVASNLASGAMKMFGVSVNTTSTSFKVLKGAIISTGIGALVVAIGYAVNALMDWYEETNKQTDATTLLKQAEDKLKQSIDDTNSSIERRNQIQEYSTNLAVATAKAQGKSAAEIRQIEMDAMRQKRGLAQDDEELARQRLDRLKRQNAEFKNVSAAELKMAEDDLNAKTIARQNAFQQERILEQNNTATTNEENKQKQQKNKDYNDKIAAQNKEKNDKIRQQEKEHREQLKKDEDAWNEYVAKTLEDENNKEKVIRDENQAEVDAADKRAFERQQKRIQDQLDYNAAVINAEEQLNQAKFSAAEAGINLLSTIASKNKALSNVMFAVEKGFAIGKIIVDTQREIAGYYANPTWKLLPDGGLSLATASATAAKIRAGISIATIAATSIGRFMNGGGANVPGGAINTKAPMTPTLSPTVQTNVQNAQAINQMSSQSTRAYVLNSDIQNEQQRNAYLQRNASI